MNGNDVACSCRHFGQFGRQLYQVYQASERIKVLDPGCPGQRTELRPDLHGILVVTDDSQPLNMRFAGVMIGISETEDLKDGLCVNNLDMPCRFRRACMNMRWAIALDLTALCSC